MRGNIMFPIRFKDVIDVLQAYDYTSVVGNITCKTLVMDGTAEMTFWPLRKNSMTRLIAPKTTCCLMKQQPHSYTARWAHMPPRQSIYSIGFVTTCKNPASRHLPRNLVICSVQCTNLGPENLPCTR